MKNKLTLKYIFYLLIALIVIKSFATLSQTQKYYTSKREQLVNITLANTARIIKEKYNLIPCGEGAAMPGGPIQKLILCFFTKYPYSKEQITSLLIQTSQELLNQVHENKEIQEFLNERPFTIRNIEIIIYNHDKNGREVYNPEISTARISNARLVYRSVDPEDMFKYKNEFYEKYEDAIKSIK